MQMQTSRLRFLAYAVWDSAIAPPLPSPDLRLAEGFEHGLADTSVCIWRKNGLVHFMIYGYRNKSWTVKE